MGLEHREKESLDMRLGTREVEMCHRAEMEMLMGSSGEMTLPGECGTSQSQEWGLC